MSAPYFKARIDNLKADPANHNRWKLLASYQAKGTAKKQASLCRRRFPDCVFQVPPKPINTPDGPRWALGVMYKRTGPDGRYEAPQATTQEAM